MPQEWRQASIARWVSSASTWWSPLKSHSDSMILIRGSSMPLTRSSVSSSDLPTLTMTSSHNGRMDLMLASTGKSSRMAFLTRVNPDTGGAVTVGNSR